MDKNVGLNYRTPNLSRRAFARTNRQTILQRVAILNEFIPQIKTIAEICCGDAKRQFQIYTKDLELNAYRCLDIEPNIVAENQDHGIECYCGDALDSEMLKKFVKDEVIFFGPPLSVNCDGHQLLRFSDVRPSYCDFVSVLLGELKYKGILVCICPNETTLGDVGELHNEIRACREDFNLRLIHHSYSTVTENNEQTEMRLKYIELWFSEKLEDLWEVRESKSVS